MTSVTFSCSDPQLPDQDDVIVIDDVTNMTSLVSGVRLEGEERGNKEMFCQCYAEWAPDPTLYIARSASLIPIERKCLNFLIVTEHGNIKKS